MRNHSLLLLASLAVACDTENTDSTEANDSPGKSSLDNDGDYPAVDTGDYEAATDIDGDPFEPDSVEAIYVPGEDPVWILTAMEGSTWLSIENYPKFGGATGAETRTLGSVEVNYATCGVCVILKTGCSPHGDHAHCSTNYMPEPGSSVTFDELGSGEGGTWSGTISPIRFVEVSFNSSTYETTPIEGGDVIELDTWSFDVTLEEG